MHKKQAAILVVLACGILAASAALNPSEERNDETAYFGLGGIEGTVTILNHQVLGKTPDNGTSVVFQRTDCPKAFFGASTDINGHYSVALSKGRYRVIMREGTHEGETWNVLAPSQVRFVEVGGPGTKTHFDIEVFFPK